MSQTISVASRGSVRATFVAAYSAVTLAQITNALPGALSGTFAGIPYFRRGPDLDRGHVLDGYRGV